MTKSCFTWWRNLTEWETRTRHQLTKTFIDCYPSSRNERSIIHMYPTPFLHITIRCHLSSSHGGVICHVWDRYLSSWRSRPPEQCPREACKREIGREDSGIAPMDLKVIAEMAENGRKETQRAYNVAKRALLAWWGLQTLKYLLQDVAKVSDISGGACTLLLIVIQRNPFSLQIAGRDDRKRINHYYHHHHFIILNINKRE